MQVSVDGEHLRETREAVLGKLRVDPPNLVRYLRPVHVCKKSEATNFQGQDA